MDKTVGLGEGGGKARRQQPMSLDGRIAVRRAVQLHDAAATPRIGDDTIMDGSLADEAVGSVHSG